MSSYRRGVVIFALCLFLSNILVASDYPPEVKKIIDAIQKNFHKIKTIQGKLKREIVMGKTVDKAEGFFTQEVPHKVSLEYTTTPRQKVVTDGKTMWIHSFTNNEVIRLDNLTPDELSTMQRFDFYYLLDEMVASPAYNIKIYSQDKNDVVLAVIPKNANPYVSQALIKVTPATGIILAYETFAPNNTLTNQIKLENYRKYPGDIYFPQKVTVNSVIGPEQAMTQTAELFRLEFNQPLAARQFEFTPPPRVKVLDRAALQNMNK